MMNYSESESKNLSVLQKLDEEFGRKLAPVTAFMAVIMVTGIVGNTLVCYIHGAKMKKSTANSFILWLAVLDLLTCLLGLPMETYDLVSHYTFGQPAVCKIFRFTVYLTITTAVTTLLFIAADRYCKICRPLKTCLIRRCRVVVVVSLTVGVILSIPALILFGKKRVSTPYPGLYGVDCSIDDNVMSTVFPRAYMITLGVAFFSSAVTLSVLYTMIAITLYKRSQAVIGENVQPTHSLRRINDHNQTKNKQVSTISHASCKSTTSPYPDKRYRVGRTSVIFLTITLVFILSFLPSLSLMTARTLRRGFAASLSDTEYGLYAFGLRTYFINNATNCIIYGFLNPLFRKECVNIAKNFKAFCGLFCLRKVQKENINRKQSTSTRSENITDDSLQAVC